MLALPLLILAATLAAEEDHLQANPVYRQLRESGLALADGVREPLREPTMADGLAAGAQHAALEEIAKGAYPLKQLLRKSVVARHILQMQQLDEGKARARRADTWFVAYGDLDAISDKEFLERLLSTEADEDETDDQGHTLSTSELAARNITLTTGSEEHEGFAHGTYALVKRVHVQGTIHWCWSRSDDSILVAGVLDSRFSDDAAFPNRWLAIERSTTGAASLGPPQPYGGMGFYVKITRMAEPPGALFVENHLIFSEPHEWFDGANYLGSKLPAIVQRQVRSIRRELVIAARGQK